MEATSRAVSIPVPEQDLLTQVLAKLPADTVLYPGHDYGPTPTSTLAAELRQNVYLSVRSLDDWRRLMA